MPAPRLAGWQRLLSTKTARSYVSPFNNASGPSHTLLHLDCAAKVVRLYAEASAWMALCSESTAVLGFPAPRAPRRSRLHRKYVPARSASRIARAVSPAPSWSRRRRPRCPSYSRLVAWRPPPSPASGICGGIRRSAVRRGPELRAATNLKPPRVRAFTSPSSRSPASLSSQAVDSIT